MNDVRIAARLGIMAVAGLFAGCASDAEPAGMEVSILDYTARVPAEWESRPPANEMRVLEYTIPAADGGESAEVVVFYFGEGQGGDAQANIDRWTSQFSNPDGGPIMPSVAELSGTAFRTIIADFEGSYGRGIGMGPGGEAAKPGQALTAAVIASPRGNLFAQLFGPFQAVVAARGDFIDFVYSLDE